MQQRLKSSSPILIVFFILSALILLTRSLLTRYQIDPTLLLGANLFFVFVSFLTMSIQLRGMNHQNPHVFVRSVLSGMILKMVLCLLATFIYVVASGPLFNKRGVLISLSFYLIYLAVEVITLTKLNRNKNA